MGAAAGCAIVMAVPLIGLALAVSFSSSSAAPSALPSAPVYLIDYKPQEYIVVLGEGQATRKGDVVNVPSAIVFQKPRHVDEGDGSIFITIYDFDCSHRRMREASGSVLDREGLPIEVWSTPEPWRPIGKWAAEAVSNEQVMFMVACENNADAAAPYAGMRDISQAAEDYFIRPR